MKWRNRITGLVTFTDRGLEYPWELVDETPQFEPPSPYDDPFDEEE